VPDYIYLLENRLSADQRHALGQLRAVAREAGSLLFLTADAVRDLTSGHAVRELEVTIQGNALKLKKTLEKHSAAIWGEDDQSRSLYLCFPGTVRVNVVSTHRVEYPKPGKTVFHPASIHEDLRRRDFTVNSMAISLNEGSFGLLMDPLNGAADIEARTLRLVSNYGFLEDPSLLIRAIRYRARLGWEMDSRTQGRYDNAKAEGVIEHLSPHARSQELEQIGHEEDGLKVLRALEDEDWMKYLFPAWSSAKADEAKLTALHDLAVELLLQGIHPDISAAQMQLLTAKLAPKELSSLKKSMLRPGFVEEWNSLDSIASHFAKALLAKQNSKPSACFKLFMSYDPEAILWLGFTSKAAAIQERYNLFLKVWPEARQRIPYALMQEMRITQDLPGYSELVEAVFFELIDGHLATPEEMRAYLEPHSPPAPPPQIAIKRQRVRRSESKVKEEGLEEEGEEEEEELAVENELETDGGDDEELDLAVLPKGTLPADMEDEGSEEDEEEDLDAEEGVAPVRKTPEKPGQRAAPAKVHSPAQTVKSLKPDQSRTALSAAKAPAKAQAVPGAKVKPAQQPPVRVESKAKAVAKTPSKAAGKAPVKKPKRPASPKVARPKAKPKPAPKPAKTAKSKAEKRSVKKSKGKHAKKR